MSTVYGPIRKGFRLGLISTLIFNGARQEVSRIFGTINTLRDYVWCEDIGNYIARAIAENDDDQNNSIVYLASGKPSSIFEIKHIVAVVSGYMSNKFNWIQGSLCDSLMSISENASYKGSFSNKDTLAT
ncbi:MAG TPA: hypothetical protein VKF42_06165, partial [Chitinivibrionales bacterium]|nr:hypothetical protein [Chitinivibrionales bacterium]